MSCTHSTTSFLVYTVHTPFLASYLSAPSGARSPCFYLPTERNMDKLLSKISTMQATWEWSLTGRDPGNLPKNSSCSSLVFRHRYTNEVGLDQSIRTD